MHLSILFIAATLVGGEGNDATDYRTAYRRAQTGDKPMLVLVTADWCAPCRQMKATTIPQLQDKNAFRGFHYATVDLGKEEDLARKLIGKRGVPQLIVFEKKEDRWQRRYLRGIQSVDTVQAFIKQSAPTRTAAAKTPIGK
jgi:thiol:disulfide interchange protein